MKVVSEPYFTDKPRYSAENWRVVIRDGVSVVNHGFHTEKDAQEFYQEQIEAAK